MKLAYEHEDCRDVFEGKMACITAHPDDEVLWAGGLLQKGDWTVICCSVPRHDPIRAYKFYQCCDVLGVKGRVLPFSEGDPSTPFPHLIALQDLNSFDGVLTHNSNGEYGHLHHRHVHEFVKQNYAGPMYVFGGENEYRLDEYEVARKMKALQCYDHRLPYNGGTPMKWEALLHRYMQDMDFKTESFHKEKDVKWRRQSVPQIKRWHVISDLVEEHGLKYGAEVGVKEGENLFFIMEHCPELKMIGVDAWEQQLSEEDGEDYRSWNMGSMYEGVLKNAERYGERLTIMKKFSVDAAKHIEDKSLDFVFIDAQHTYDSLKADIQAWEPKLREGGFMLGHDIHFPGVLKAVKEIYPDYIELENKVWMRP